MLDIGERNPRPERDYSRGSDRDGGARPPYRRYEKADGEEGGYDNVTRREYSKPVHKTDVYAQNWRAARPVGGSSDAEEPSS